MGDIQLKRQLKIKTGACRRLHKDYTSYQQEAQDQEKRVNQLASNPQSDEYAVKKQREVLSETQSMISDSKERLHVARDDLIEFLQSLGTLGNSIGTEADDARAIIQQTASIFP